MGNYPVCTVCISQWVGQGPGGGDSQYILVGVCRGTSKKGGLRHGHNKKGGGVLGTGTTQKRGVLVMGTSPKRGVLGTGEARKRGVLGTGQVKRGVFTAAHTCTGHICECPPGPRKSAINRKLQDIHRPRPQTTLRYECWTVYRAIFLWMPYLCRWHSPGCWVPGRTGGPTWCSICTFYTRAIPYSPTEVKDYPTTVPPWVWNVSLPSLLHTHWSLFGYNLHATQHTPWRAQAFTEILAYLHQSAAEWYTHTQYQDCYLGSRQWSAAASWCVLETTPELLRPCCQQRSASTYWHTTSCCSAPHQNAYVPRLHHAQRGLNPETDSYPTTCDLGLQIKVMVHILCTPTV